MPRKPRPTDPIDPEVIEEHALPVCAHGVVSNDGSCMHAPVDVSPTAGGILDSVIGAKGVAEAEKIDQKLNDAALFKQCERAGCNHTGRHVHMDEVPEPPPTLLDEVARAAKQHVPAAYKRGEDDERLFPSPVIDLDQVYFYEQTRVGNTNEYSILPGLKNCPPDHKNTRLRLDLRARLLLIEGKARGGEPFTQVVPIEAIKSMVPKGFSMKGAV